MVHSYGDHVSFDKFVEANWGLETIAPDGRDKGGEAVRACLALIELERRFQGSGN